MPTISVKQNLLRRLVESRGRVHDVEDLAFRLPLMGTDIDTCDEDVLDIEIFPDRPDFCLLYTSPSPRDVEESRIPG